MGKKNRIIFGIKYLNSLMRIRDGKIRINTARDYLCLSNAINSGWTLQSNWTITSKHEDKHVLKRKKYATLWKKEYHLSEEERVYGGAAGEDDKREGDRHTDHKAQFHQVCNIAVNSYYHNCEDSGSAWISIISLGAGSRSGPALEWKAGYGSALKSKFESFRGSKDGPWTWRPEGSKWSEGTVRTVSQGAKGFQVASCERVFQCLPMLLEAGNAVKMLPPKSTAENAT
jgi:hypothetical protein